MTRISKDEITERPKVYRKLQGNDKRVWYIPIATNVADWFKGVGDSIHVTDPEPVGGMRGYGGSTLEFPLEDGTVDEVKGPWHTNSEAFFSATGLNISDLHYTCVTIGTERGEGLMEVGGEIIYQDPGWVLGPFMRGERIAHQLADVHNRRLYVVRESQVGGSAGFVEPNTTPHPMARRKGDA